MQAPGRGHRPGPRPVVDFYHRVEPRTLAVHRIDPCQVAVDDAAHVEPALAVRLNEIRDAVLGRVATETQLFSGGTLCHCTELGSVPGIQHIPNAVKSP